MDFKTAVQTCFSKYATISGRAARSEFWWFMLFQFVIQIVASLLDGAMGTYVLATLASLAVLLPVFSVTIRRLHDIGRSGWWLLLCLIPIVGFLIQLYWYVQPSDPNTNQYGAP